MEPSELFFQRTYHRMPKTVDGRQLLQFNQPNVQWKDFRKTQPKSRGSPVEKRIRCVINSM